jgi:hypothetical protein
MNCSLSLVAGFPCPLLLVVRNEAVGIDDGGAALALSDIPAERERLTPDETSASSGRGTHVR